MEGTISNHNGYHGYNSTMTTEKHQADHPRTGRIDIAQFVSEVEKFNKLIEPFAFVIYIWDDVRRWRYPYLSAILWMLCNIGCFVLTQGAVFALVSLLVITIVTLCLLQTHTRILDKILPETMETEDTWSDGTDDEQATMQTVRDFRYSLQQMHEFVMKCNEYLTHFYSILKWDSTGPALRFHIELCTFLLCLVVLPLRWNFFLLANWFFVATDDVYSALIGYVFSAIQCIQGKKSWSAILKLPPKKQLTVTKETSSNSCDDRDILEGQDDMDKDIYPEVLDENMSISDDLDTELKSQQNKPGMVARLLELKKRRQHIANESCFDCKVSFSSILKRRGIQPKDCDLMWLSPLDKKFYCRHCGNNFCSKCCNQKVPKSLFGATEKYGQQKLDSS